jgi:hypothetical protein
VKPLEEKCDEKARFQAPAPKCDEKAMFLYGRTAFRSGFNAKPCADDLIDDPYDVPIIAEMQKIPTNSFIESKKQQRPHDDDPASCCQYNIIMLEISRILLYPHVSS